MLPKVSVLIAAKNEEKVIARCLESFLNSDYPEDKLEILVNVNGSSDNTYEICKKYKKVKTIKTPAKKNRGEALNELIPMAGGEIIAIFDADTFVEKDCLKQAVNRFSDQTVMGVSGLMKTIKNSIISKTISLENTFFYLVQYILNHKMDRNSCFVGNYFIRKRVFEELGYLDVVSYLDDAELTARMKEHNYKIVFEPKAVAWEHRPNSIKAFYKQRSRWSRSCLRLWRIKRKKMNHLLPEILHGLAYFIAPLGIIILGLTTFSVLFNINTLLLLPLLIIFFSLIGFMGYSKIFCDEPFTDILFFPLWFLLTTFYVFVLFPKAYIEEKLNKRFVWQDLERR